MKFHPSLLAGLVIDGVQTILWPFWIWNFQAYTIANLHRLKVLVERSETLQPDSIQCESVFPSAALGSVFTRLLGQPDNERVAIKSTFHVQNSPTESAWARSWLQRTLPSQVSLSDNGEASGRELTQSQTVILDLRFAAAHGEGKY